MLITCYESNQNIPLINLCAGFHEQNYWSVKWKLKTQQSFKLLHICQALTDYAISCRIRPSKMINDKYPITLVIAFDQHIIVNGSLYNLTAIQRIMTFE